MTVSRRGAFTTVVLLLAGLTILSGCGERKETRTPKTLQTVRVALPPANAGQNALYAAIDAGYFAQAGLKVVPSVKRDAAVAIQQVQQGRADLAVGTEPDLLEARGGGGRVVSVATMVQHPLTSLIAPKLSLGTVIGLATKPIGTMGADYQQAFAETIFRRAHVVKVSDPMKALRSKKVAAVIAPIGTAPVPSGTQAIPVDRLKVPTFSEFVLVANQDALGADDTSIRAFVAALARGTRNLAAARRVPRIQKLPAAQVGRVRALMLPPAGKPYGWHNAAAWRSFAGWMRAHSLQQKLAGAFTNDFLPGLAP